MGVPKVYRKTPEKALATYDFFDIAEGTGIVKYFAYTNKDDSGTNHALITKQIHSRDIESTSVTAEGALAKVMDFDFDLNAFNLPRTIEGTALISVPLEAEGSLASAAFITAFIIARIRKFDGSTETDIASTQSETIAIDDNWKIISPVIIDVPKTLFKKGENLRVTIEIWARRSNATARSIALGHDPKNRDGVIIKPSVDSEIVTTLEIYIPFNIDL